MNNTHTKQSSSNETAKKDANMNTNNSSSNQKWEMVIGLEVHAQISTKSKLFSRAATQFGAEPNSSVDYLDLGLPGALPVLNESCVDKAILTAHALNMKVNQISEFDRKHYFYPDLPLGYQITQFYHPIAEHGHIPVWSENETKNIRINRIHMETDAGKSVHKNGKTYIDLNRCGIPLMEIVTEPDMRSADEAATFLRILQATLSRIDTCDANMERGQFRADLNISLRKPGEEFGTRVEVKNLNSVNFMKKAVAYEYDRQSKILEAGDKVIQETRLFDEKQTIRMREKEDASDYRYMPDPDLPRLILSEEKMNQVSDKKLPYKICHDISTLGIDMSDAWTVAENEKLTYLFFESTNNVDKDVKLMIFKWLIGDVSAYMNKNPNAEINPQYLSKLVQAVYKGDVSGKVAKDILIEFIETNQDPIRIIEEKGLGQINDPDKIQKAVMEVIAKHDKELQQYKNGNTNLKQFFVGKVMQFTKGKANPSMTQEIIDQCLNS